MDLDKFEQIMTILSKCNDDKIPFQVGIVGGMLGQVIEQMRIVPIGQAISIGFYCGYLMHTLIDEETIIL